VDRVVEPGARGLGGSGTGELGNRGTGELGNAAAAVGRSVAPRLLLWLLAAACLLGPVAAVPAAAQPPRTPAAQDEFVPMDKLPTEESLPATPLVLIAYAVAWLAVLVYLVSIWQRMGRVEREIAEVTRRLQQRSGG
jgi:CcmD family protein